jgi:hypothetical protein
LLKDGKLDPETLHQPVIGAVSDAFGHNQANRACAPNAALCWLI